jgi:hypothetical protein
MRDQDRSAEQRVAGIAARQHGLITWLQLLAAGLSPDGIRRRLDKGLLHRVYRGVYRVGHTAPSVESDYLAAVLACGEGAVLSGRAAAHVYALIKEEAPPPEVTSVKDRRVQGVITHRVRQLHPLDQSTYRSIPITTVPCTLVALAATLELDDLARACHEAEGRFRTKAAMVEAALARRPNAEGAQKLHANFRGEVRVTLSELERVFLDALRGDGLVLPVTNRPAGAHYVDCRWPEHKLTVELDSYRYHHSRYAWEQDRQRERDARARGDEFRRYTWDDVTVGRALMLVEMRELLRRGGVLASVSAG